MSLSVRKPTIWVPTRSDTNLPVQSRKQAISLKFWIKVEEILYYLCSENKGADQLRSYCKADLHLVCTMLGFPMRQLISKDFRLNTLLNNSYITLNLKNFITNNKLNNLQYLK